MNLSSFSFHIEEAGKNIRRNGLMSLAALTTVAVSMAVLGGALFALYRLHQLVEAQPRQFEIAVYVHSSTSREDVEELKSKIAKYPGVAHVALITKEEALRDLEDKDRQAGTSLSAEIEGANPLPDRLDVRLVDPHETSVFSATLSDPAKYPEIEKVRDARQEIEILFSVQRMIRNIGLAAGTLLFIGTAFVIQNSLRLTIIARRREIRIMQLVGATPGFIRFPMMLEGIFYGAAGSLIAAALVIFVANQLSTYAERIVSPLANMMPKAAGPAIIIGLMVGVGVAIGWSGSLLSIRRFLKRI